MSHAGTVNAIRDASSVASLFRRPEAPVAPAASRPPARPATDTARGRRALTAVAAIGLVWSLVGPAGGTPPPPAKTPQFTLTGTTMTPDGKTPVQRARITVMPASTVTYTDADGDFIAPWDGADGWITIVTEERARDGSEWCKRVVLRAMPPDAPDPILDLGLISCMPKAQVGYRQQPVAPVSGPRPAVVRVPGPQPGEPDTCRIQMSYAADLWGHTTRAEIVGGDPAPAALKDEIIGWLRSVTWEVGAESPCDAAEPFKTEQWIDYAWADTAWVQIPGLKANERPRRPGAPPGR